MTEQLLMLLPTAAVRAALAPRRKLYQPSPTSVSAKLLELMRDGHWRILSEMQAELCARGCAAGEAAISARLRELRTLGHTIDARLRSSSSRAVEYSLRRAFAPEVQQ
jgi:hypothetical protein